jgi:hypothetical protein
MCIVVAILKLPPDASCFYLPVKEAIPWSKCPDCRSFQIIQGSEQMLAITQPPLRGSLSPWWYPASLRLTVDAGHSIEAWDSDVSLRILLTCSSRAPAYSRLFLKKSPCKTYYSSVLRPHIYFWMNSQ